MLEQFHYWKILKNQNYLIIFIYQVKFKKIILILDELYSLLATIIQTSKVNLLSQYLLNLSNSFNSFYAETKLINNVYEEYYSALVKAVQIVFKLVLNLIGVSAPKSM
ncbi:DALR anticodon-binding domain-containing protein [Mycoplasmopsis cynos]|nr:DALR anticodon-binding domain-containing protein [Mycoplasmopsis cynos]WAM05206.1 DALR anticodon-binding domain-containing protein [Mycoplasmopsis cynos]